MTPRVMGIEIEYAAAMAGRSGSAPSAQAAAAALMRIARDRLTHLSDSNGGIFLTNGARLYLDTGHHPEICTPEVDHPDDCVRYMLACESILADLARKLSRPLLKTGILLFKCNVDYWRPDVTWACHESYLHRANLCALPSQLIAHLVSRVWCGAGGLNPLCAGIQFSLSPRAHIFVKEVSNSTTSCRGIFNTRDESLASGRYRRLHVICCDSLCSQTGLWLRLGTTCLVLAMAEGGLRPGEAVQLREPVEALHRFAADPYFRAAAELTDGRRMTALQIQRH